MTSPPVAAPTARGAPTLADDLARCVHCGFCLQACPTYLELGMETDSPRGRIALISALASGRSQPTTDLLRHLDACLQCRACETACPSGVAYGRIMETARAEVLGGGRAPLSWRLRARALRAVVGHPGRISTIMSLLRLYGRTLRPLVGRARVLRLTSGLARADTSLPRPAGAPFVLPPQPDGPARRVALLTGCVMGHLYPRTHKATVRVLNALGYRVVVPPAQTCCGALSLHAGDRAFARELARRNIEAFLRADVEAVIVNAAGCGSTMKEYTGLLAEDAAYSAGAGRLASMTHDVLEFVATRDLPPLGEVRRTVTYQDSCHLVHAQRVAVAPRRLLAAIPGLELRELTAPDRCCGSAGLYSLVQSAMSRQLLGRKMDDVAATGAATIATANPGCMMQLEAGLRERGMAGEVVHVIELLDEAIRAAAGAPVSP